MPDKITMDNIKNKAVFNRQQEITKENEIKVGDKYIDYFGVVTVVSVHEGQKQLIIEVKINFDNGMRVFRLLYLDEFKIEYKQKVEE